MSRLSFLPLLIPQDGPTGRHGATYRFLLVFTSGASLPSSELDPSLGSPEREACLRLARARAAPNPREALLPSRLGCELRKPVSLRPTSNPTPRWCPPHRPQQRSSWPCFCAEEPPLPRPWRGWGGGCPVDPAPRAGPGRDQHPPHRLPAALNPLARAGGRHALLSLRLLSESQIDCEVRSPTYILKRLAL